ncbi:MAG: Stk1 family PASTA domain-containing Ser/Thr kinase [Ruminococcaceae bacterium]|nr:Stk1 family PASTA domain-containing Ser/Thr kinase [Oscillospiraceae bacterium]
MDRFVGKRLDGRYEIKEIIGVGGMAVVYKAYDNIEDRIVAVKILKEEFVSNEEFTRRFKNESKAIAVLSHPNIVKVFDVSFGDLIQYIVMEYIDGITLKELIEKEGSLRWKDALYFTVQILKGLQHAHDKGIVHRDIKPQNIMVLSDGTIKVTDFGIARFARSEQRTITDKAIGSVHYISPEQARGDATDEKADIYSVGVMLYEMLTGQLPFEADSAVSVAIMQLQREPKMPRDINGSIPEGLEQITMHAMQKNSERRYKSAAEMLCDLEEFKKDPSATFSYNYFVDNSPTKYISDANVNTEEDTEDEGEEKSPIIPVLAGIAVTFVIGVIVILSIFLPRLFGGTGGEISCPKLVGQHWETVDNNEEYDEIFSKIDFVWKNNSEYEFGYIYQQSKPEGKKIKAGNTITAYVSMGKKTVIVPDVYEYTDASAITVLENLGFKCNVVKVNDEKIDKDMVIKTQPERGFSAYEGDEITIYVSLGKPTVYVELPNVIGLTEEDAKKRLEKDGLKVGVVTYVYNSPAPKGVVVGQNPSAGQEEQVGEGTAVDLEVSNGETQYTIKFDVQLPTDFIYDIGKVSVWVGGEMVYETPNKIEINKKGTCSVEFTSKVKEESVTVKLSDGAENPTYKDYKDYRVNCENNTIIGEETHQYPKKPNQ